MAQQVARRTVARGAAWATPVLAVGAATPAMAASGCVPEVTILEDSFKCCSGDSLKTIRLRLSFDNPNACAGPGDTVCVIGVTIETAGGQDFPFTDKCGPPGTEVTLTISGITSCPANLLITYTVNDGPPVVGSVDLGNISGGTEDDCQDDCQGDCDEA
jgi:hypothetical protein